MTKKTTKTTKARWQASVLATLLKDKGFPVVSSSEADMIEDGEVTINDRVHVQVGFHAINVVVEHEGGKFEFYPLAKTFAQLVNDLHRALRGRREAA